ncbi:MAG: DUF2780 domain-containing protein [Gammaproteobacteria bacterium]
MNVYRWVRLACVSLLLNACSLANQDSGEEQVMAELPSVTEAVAGGISSDSERDDTALKRNDSSEPELIGMLVDRLGVDQKQAWGGVGAVLALVQQRTSPEDFMQLRSSIPDVDRFLASVPSPQTSSFKLGTERYETADSNSAFLSLANSFRDLGLGTEMIDRFVPIVIRYLQDRNELASMSVLQNALY